MAEIIPVITEAISQNPLIRDLLFCCLYAMIAAVLRQAAPYGNRWTDTVADFIAVGLLGVLLQGYAAGNSAAGGVRWYMLFCAAGSFLWVDAKLSTVRRRFYRLFYPKSSLSKEKTQKNTVERSQMQKKQLQNNSFVLYNSNV